MFPAFPLIIAVCTVASPARAANDSQRAQRTRELEGLARGEQGCVSAGEDHGFQLASAADTSSIEKAVMEVLGAWDACNLSRFVGRGSSGTVSIVRCLSSNRSLDVAVKHSRIEAGDAWATNELEVLRRLDTQEDFIGFYGHYQTKSDLYLILQAADASLNDYSRGNFKGKMGALDYAVKVSWLVQLLRGLAKLERLGLAHHDVKPANALIIGKCTGSDDCSLVLADFGLTCTKLAAEGSPIQRCKLEQGFWYRSPEFSAARDAGSYGDMPSSKIDVWAAGVVAFELLEGREPWPELIATEQDSRSKADALKQYLLDLHQATVDRKARTWQLGWWRWQLGWWSKAPRPLDSLPKEHPWRPLLEGMLEPDAERRLTPEEACERAEILAKDLGVRVPPPRPTMCSSEGIPAKAANAALIRGCPAGPSTVG